MGYLDIITIIAFSILIFICGMVFSKSGKNMKSFFAAGGAVPWWINGLSLFMSFFSAGTFVVWGAIAYKFGWVAVAIQWTMSISGFIIGFVFAPKWQKTGALTAAEFITQRLGYNTQKIYSYLFLAISIFTTGAFLYPVARILQVSTGIPVYAGVLGLGLLIMIYTTVGGLWAVIVTDVLQFIVLTAAVLIVVPLSFQHIGGIGNFINKAPTHFFDLINNEYSIGFLIAFNLYNLFFISGNWAYVQRYTSVKTAKDAKKVGWLFGCLYLISPVIWMLPPMIYRIINPSLSGLGNEGAYLLMCKIVLPVGMLGLILGGMIFATSSSVNTTLNISAGVFTNDLYKHFFPQSTDRQLIKVARYATLGFGVCTIIVALLVPFMGGIVEVVLSMAAITGAAMYLPPLWCLFSKYQNGKTVLTITIVSLSINLLLKFIMPLTVGLSLSRSMEMIVGVGIPIFLLCITEVVLRASYGTSQDYEHYLLTRSASAAEEKGDITADDQDNVRGIKVIALGVGVTGLMIIALGIIAYRHTWLVLCMGIIILLLGIFIFPRKSRHIKKATQIILTKDYVDQE